MRISGLDACASRQTHRDEEVVLDLFVTLWQLALLIVFLDVFPNCNLMRNFVLPCDDPKDRKNSTPQMRETLPRLCTHRCEKRRPRHSTEKTTK